MARLEVEEVVAIEPDEGFLPWYVSWSGVFVGALSALALLLVFGLTAIAVGAYQIGQRFATWHEFHLITLVFSVFGSFLSFVLGGWAAARVTGTRRAEIAMLHGAIAWLVTIPGLLFFAALGAGGYLGTWYGGPRRAARLGASGDADGRERRGRARRAKRRARRLDGAAAGPRRLGGRRLDGLGGAHEPEIFEQTAPPACACVGREPMMYILLWLLGAPLTLILILFLIGVGR